MEQMNIEFGCINHFYRLQNEVERLKQELERKNAENQELSSQLSENRMFILDNLIESMLEEAKSDCK